MGILEFFKRRPADDVPDRGVPGNGEREEYLDFLGDQVRALVEGGFHDLDEAEETLLEVFLDDPESPLTREEVLAALQRAWAERLEEQASWTDEGDYARLAAAFDRLEAEGIVARMNFTCCQTCGHDEIDDQRADDSRGYVFWHQQDTERLPDGDLFLAFGGFTYSDRVDPELLARARAGDEEAKAEAIRRTEELIGAEIAQALRDVGLTVDWDGTCESRIQVTDVDWRKRLPTG